MPTHLYIVYGCFHGTMAELSSDRSMIHKAPNIYPLVPHRKSLPNSHPESRKGPEPTILQSLETETVHTVYQRAEGTW